MAMTHLVSIVIYVSGAKFEKHCFNIPEIFFYLVFYHFSCKTSWHSHFSYLHNTKISTSLRNGLSYSKKEIAIRLLYFEKPFKYAAIIFGAGTLMATSCIGD